MDLKRGGFEFNLDFMMYSIDKTFTLCYTKLMEKYMDNKILFIIFCIESLAEKCGKSGTFIYDIFTKRTNILNEYISNNYEVLHSQGKKYIVNDLENKLKEEGIVI